MTPFPDSDSYRKGPTGISTTLCDVSDTHHKNKELTLTVSLAQTKPFPHGEYVLKYNT